MFSTALRLALSCLLLGAATGRGQVETKPDQSPSGARKTVLVLGDSLAAGYGVESEAAFPALLQSKIDSAGLGFTMVNAGVSGDTSAGGLRRINWLLRRPVDVLILELGGNDGLRGIQPATTRSNLQQIIERTRDKNPGVRVVIAGMRMPDNMGEEFTRGFREVFGELARTNRASLIPFLLEGVGGDPALNQPDLIHPNAEGHRRVAANVWGTLEPVLREIAIAPDGAARAAEDGSQAARTGRAVTDARPPAPSQ